MNSVATLLGFQLTMGLPEFIICELGALILGFTIHFFWNSKKDLRIDDSAPAAGISENDNWKLKYYNDMDMQERMQQELRERLSQLQETEEILTIELEEGRKEYERLRKELDDAQRELEEVEYRRASSQETLTPVIAHASHEGPAGDYLSQLKHAQEKLIEHNNSIHLLLQQTELLGDAEKRNQDLQKQNEYLNGQLSDAHRLLSEKDNEIVHLRQHQKMTEEMKQQLDTAYGEYNSLQEKLQKLQGYLTQPYKKSADYEELQDAYFRLNKEHGEMKLRQVSMREENQRMSRILADTEDKLKEANFQRHQFQKRAVFLEELNNDLQEVAEHNKRIESQLRRISEMEELLTKGAEQRAEG